MDKSNYSLVDFVKPTGQTIAQFCRAMASRGEIVKKVVQESGVSVTKLARKISISRAQLYLDFSNPEMSFDRILAIGKALNHDFSVDFKELGAGMVSLVNEEQAPYVRELDACRTRLMDTQAQLITTMQLLDQYKEKYGPIQSD